MTKQRVTFNAAQVTQILWNHILAHEDGLAITLMPATAPTNTMWDIMPNPDDNSITLTLEDDS